MSGSLEAIRTRQELIVDNGSRASNCGELGMTAEVTSTISRCQHQHATRLLRARSKIVEKFP